MDQNTQKRIIFKGRILKGGKKQKPKRKKVTNCIQFISLLKMRRITISIVNLPPSPSGRGRGRGL